MRLLLMSFLAGIITSLDAQIIFSGKISGLQTGDTIEINIPFDAWYYKNNNILLKTDNHGAFLTVLPVKKAQNIFLIYKGKKLVVYAEPGKDVFISFNKDSLAATATFAGSLKKENDFRKHAGLMVSQVYNKRWDDTLVSPQQIVAELKAYQLAALNKFVALKSYGSPAFKNITQKDLQYFLPGALWEIIWNKGVFSTNNTRTSERKFWIQALQQVYEAQPLSDDDAVDSYFYQLMVANYPRYLEITAADKEAFKGLAEKNFRQTF